MPLVLSIPGLLAREPLPAAPSLARLLSYARSPRREESGIAAALAPRYGVHRETDWPLAPIRASALGIDVGDAYWLAAHPVMLVAGRDDVMLQGAVTDLSGDEVRALIATLNTHFASDGIAFVAPQPDAWFVRAATSPTLVTHSLDSALGRSLRGRLPDGADGSTWRRWMNEIQMLLFEHPANVARERAGRRVANSVWLEFGGTMPSHAAAARDVRTWSDDATVAALAAFADAPARSPPRSLDAVLAEASRDDTSIVAFASTARVDAVDRDFAAPAVAALLHDAVDAVIVVSDGDGAAVEWRAERPSAWSRLTRRFGAADLRALVGAQHA